MYCTHCGSERPAGATACPNCGQQVQLFPPPPVVKNYLVPAVLTTLCCCLPFGIVALVYAAQVNSKLAAGDVAGAVAASGSARTWCIVGVVGGILTGAGVGLVALL